MHKARDNKMSRCDGPPYTPSHQGLMVLGDLWCILRSLHFSIHTEGIFFMMTYVIIDVKYVTSVYFLHNLI